MALIFGIVNAIVKPIFTLFTAMRRGAHPRPVPDRDQRLMLLLTSWLSDQFDLGWSVDGFWTALLGSIIVSIVSFVLNTFIPDKDEPVGVSAA